MLPVLGTLFGFQSSLWGLFTPTPRTRVLSTLDPHCGKVGVKSKGVTCPWGNRQKAPLMKGDGAERPLCGMQRSGGINRNEQWAVKPSATIEVAEAGAERLMGWPVSNE